MKLVAFTVRVPERTKEELERRRLEHRRKLNEEVNALFDMLLFGVSDPLSGSK